MTLALCGGVFGEGSVVRSLTGGISKWPILSLAPAAQCNLEGGVVGKENLGVLQKIMEEKSPDELGKERFCFDVANSHTPLLSRTWFEGLWMGELSWPSPPCSRWSKRCPSVWLLARAILCVPQVDVVYT